MKHFSLFCFTALISLGGVLAGDSSLRGRHIECFTPDGRVTTIGEGSDSHGPAQLVSPDTLSCALAEGETTFVIKLSGASFLDRFTFVNENATAAGRLKISVSNDPLPVTSPKWVEVDGNIPFRCKRLFNVSTVGVEARFVKLSFQVEKTERLALLGL